MIQSIAHHEQPLLRIGHIGRYALRSLWHSKGFALVAILCLGFGIGVNSTIFSIVDGVLLKPYPYTDPDRLAAASQAAHAAAVPDAARRLEAIESLEEHLLWGSLLASLVVMFFIRNIRAGRMGSTIT